MYGKTNPTRNVANQFTMVAMVTATGLVSCRKSSGTIVHGTAPAKKKKEKKKKKKKKDRCGDERFSHLMMTTCAPAV